MAFFPDVTAGERFAPNARLENSLRHMVNAQNGMGAIAPSGGGSQPIRVQVYNYSQFIIPAGCAVNFGGGGTMCGNALPCYPVSDVSLPWGIVPYELEPNKMGDCIVSGAVQVRASIKTGLCVMPDLEHPGMFVQSKCGAPILFATNIAGQWGATEMNAVILLGGASQAKNTASDYKGPFCIEEDETDNRRVLIYNPFDATCIGKVIVGKDVLAFPNASYTEQYPYSGMKYIFVYVIYSEFTRGYGLYTCGSNADYIPSDDGIDYFCIGAIDAEKNIYQWQHGNIRVCGRAF